MVPAVTDKPSDDFENDLIKQLMEMFSEMNMPLDENMFSELVRQLISKFESMGIDPETLDGKGMNINIDVSALRDAFAGGANLSHIFSNLGFKVEARDSAGEQAVDVPVQGATQPNEIQELPTADWYLSGWHLHATVDLSGCEEVDDEVSLHLVEDGRLLEIHVESVIQPLRRIRLPQACDDIVNWEINNGIFDLKLHLTPPQNSGVIDIEEE